MIRSKTEILYQDEWMNSFPLNSVSWMLFIHKLHIAELKDRFRLQISGESRCCPWSPPPPSQGYSRSQLGGSLAFLFFVLNWDTLDMKLRPYMTPWWWNRWCFSPCFSWKILSQFLELFIFSSLYSILCHCAFPRYTFLLDESISSFERYLYCLFICH